MPALARSRSLLATVLAVSSLTALAGLQASAAGPTHGVRVGPSGLPLPRFVSLKADRVNMRVGPGLNYQINWLYLRDGLPMEIVQEFDTWRRVRDSDGAEGWINQALLSGRRTAMAAPWYKGKQAPIVLYGEPNKNAGIVANVEAGAIGRIESCNGTWCEMHFGSYTGWMEQALIWGAYPGETIKD